jgi:hypothetical protein
MAHFSSKSWYVHGPVEQSQLAICLFIIIVRALEKQPPFWGIALLQALFAM